MKKTYKIETEIDANKLLSIISTAFDSGIGYWCKSAHPEWPKGLRVEDIEWIDDIEFWKGVSKLYIAPLVDGGKVILEEVESDGDPSRTRTLVLDEAAIIRGLSAMQRESPRHWSELLSDNYDAETADVFMQCCLFGKLVYG